MGQPAHTAKSAVNEQFERSLIAPLAFRAGPKKILFDVLRQVQPPPPSPLKDVAPLGEQSVPVGLYATRSICPHFEMLENLMQVIGLPLVHLQDESTVIMKPGKLLLPWLQETI